MVALVGPVGAGKTSFLSAVAGGLKLTHGRLAIREDCQKIAFVGQNSWILNASFKQNIIFPHSPSSCDMERYQQVLDACCLMTDLAALPAGDGTLLGDRGINLSGGQRARVALARAIYSDADLYLLDDPLSAVDARVGQLLFNDCILALLKGKKTCLLATHQLQYLPHVSSILMLEGGAVVHSGTYAQLTAQGISFGHCASADPHCETQAHDETPHSSLSPFLHASPLMHSPSLLSVDPSPGSPSSPPLMSTPLTSHFWEVGHHDASAPMDRDALELNETEDERAEGQVRFSVYLGYLRFFRAPGWIAAVVLLMVCSEVALVLSNLLIGFWTMQLNVPPDAHSNYTSTASSLRSLVDQSLVDRSLVDRSIADRLPFYSVMDWLVSYSTLAGLSTFLLLLGYFLWYRIATDASTNSHATVLGKVFAAPMRFFHVTPLGNILNRFSKDQSDVDLAMPDHSATTLRLLLSNVGIIVLCLMASPFFAVLIVAAAFVYLWIANRSRPVQRDAARLESTLGGPINTLFDEVLEGRLETRCYRYSQSFEVILHERVERSIAAQLVGVYAAAWAEMRLELLSSVLFFGLGVISIVSIRAAPDDRLMTLVSLSGLALSFSLTLCHTMQDLLYHFGLLESKLNKIERILDYAEMDSEPQAQHSSAVDPSWPQQGQVVFDGACARYHADGPLVLRHMHFAIPGGAKVGIVGRTGAGKSSLVSALFRLMELESGRILIDGLDTAQLSLHELRRQIAIIPQDPFLFQGTLRDNLDPSHPDLASEGPAVDDCRLWDALEKVGLKGFFCEQEEGLEFAIKEKGTNLSLGQRQLLCLARVLVRPHRILVMDEATASVDQDSDHLIQQTIRQCFAECTILTIAHRLLTVIDYDLILVIDDGQVVQSGHPAQLLQLLAEESPFARLVEETGPEMKAKLHSIAFSSFKENK